MTDQAHKDAARPEKDEPVAANLAGMHPQTLRIYERRGLIEPFRTPGGTRRYSEEDLASTTTGGSPYGATHVTWNRDVDELSAEEKRLAIALGKRVADVARRLAINN